MIVRVQELSYPAGTASFTLSHLYIDESPVSTGSGTHAITATYLGAAGWDSASTTITVNNAPPVLSNIAISPSPAFAGQTAVLTGSITDGPLDSHTVQINWGDASPNTTLSLWIDQRNFGANHQYALSGNFNITLTATDNDGGATSGGIGVTVNPFPTIPNAPSNLTATAVSSTQINLQWTDNSSNEHAFVILRCQGTGPLPGSRKLLKWEQTSGLTQIPDYHRGNLAATECTRSTLPVPRLIQTSQRPGLHEDNGSSAHDEPRSAG